MDNRPDHIEDSLRKAFEGFELPVADTDWNAIEKGLLQHDNRRKGLLWFIKSWPFRIITLGIIITIIGVLVYQQRNSNIQTGVTRTETTGTNPAPLKAKTQEQYSAVSGDKNQLKADNNAAVNNNNKPMNSVAIQESINGISSGRKTTTANINEGQQIKNESVSPAPDETANKNAGNINSVIVPSFRFNSAALSVLNFEKPEFLATALKTADARNHKPESTPVEKGFYMGLDFNTARMNTQASKSGIWADPAVTSSQTGINNLLNLNLSGGWFISKKGWKVSTGASLEGNPATTATENQYTVKVPKRFLPYFDRSGNLLYWLAVDWKDSVVKSKESRTQVWFELPVNLQKSWKLNRKVSFSAGLSFNPGMAVLNRGKMINPFISQSGSFWQYQTGLSADTASIFTDSRQYLSKFRMGNGLMLNLQGKTANFDWELGFNSRYYYTNVWKQNALPWQQRNISIGLQCKLSKKF